MGGLRLLVISERYWPEGGGGELATHLILDVLRREFDITVLTGTREVARLSGVQYLYEPLQSRIEKALLWFNVSRLARSERFEKLLRDSDVVYVPRFAFPVIPRAKRLGKRVVVHLHGYAPVSYTATILAPYNRRGIALDDIALECRKSVKHCMGAAALWWLPRLARRWISQADRVICVSRRHAEIVSELAPELREKIEVVYNPPPPRLVAEEPRKELGEMPTFLYVGGDSYVKGFRLLLRAVRRLAEYGVEAEFVFANSYGPESLQMLREMEKSGTISVKVVGRVNYEELFGFYQRAWGLLFPSLWEEPLPYAVLESVLSATVPVAAKVGGVREVIGGTPAEVFLFEPGDAEGLAERVKLLASHSPSGIKEVGARLRRHALEFFNVEKIRTDLVKIFTSRGV